VSSHANRRVIRRARHFILASLVGLGTIVSTTPAVAGPFDPVYRFRAVPTEHFIVYFHQGEELLAARLAVIAEETWRNLERPLGRKPPPLTHVVLVDQSELANGSAYPLPYNTIVVTAVWPAGSDFIGNTEDWLRLVFTHEFTHIVHLDRSEGWARVVRGIFGRIDVAFPNLYLPAWQIEGLATYEESALTGEGRMHAGDFQSIVGEAARAKRLAPLDRVNGGLTDWPNGLAAYAYGLGFHAYLAERYGADKFAALANATARRVPFTASRVFARVYGRSLGALWRDYQASLTAAVAPAPEGDHATRLTHHGFTVLGPRFMRPSCAPCAPDVIYSVRTPHGFPSITRITLDGSRPTAVTTRYLGSTTAIGRDRIYFDQQELRRNTGVYSDLYALERATGRVRRVTADARLLDPDLSPDERTIVAAQNTPGRRDLVLVRLKADSTYELETLTSESETQFNAPRWSPDGRTIAVERHRAGHQAEIVLVDVALRAVRVLASDPNARWVTPAWRPDGRAVVAAADLNEGPFNLYEIDDNDSTADRAELRARQLTHTTGGALWPDVSPDGASIVYVGYTPDGFDLFQLPYPGRPSSIPNAISHVAGADPRVRPQADAQVGRYDVTRGSPYDPWRTLKPTWWSPVVDADHTRIRVGAATGGVDVLGYHAYSASATWLVSRPGSAPVVGDAAPDWQAFYVYDRWRPAFWMSASRDTSFFGGPPSDSGVPSTATLRERQLQAGVVLPVRHVRVSHTTLASVVRAVDDFTFPDRSVSRNRTAVRAGSTITSAHTYGYSISPERGATAGFTAELVRRALGSSGDATAVTADVRAYLPGLAPHHVLAVRAAGGSSNGDRDVFRSFNLGGALSNVATLDFGREAISLLRGFPADTFAGTRVALVNADYRWPIVRLQRGLGTLPIFLHTLHASVFADAGHGWARTFDARHVKTSAGAELSLDFVAAYALPFTASVGAAWGHDGSHTVSDRATVYFRLGHAF
jgi:Tol biopolymer transport system component